HGVGMARGAQRLEDDLFALPCQFHIRIGRAADGAQRAFDGDAAAGEVDLNALGHGNRIFSDSRHGLSQATMHSTSPPTPSARALRSVMTPREVDRMATPRPFMTRGMSSRPL